MRGDLRAALLVGLAWTGGASAQWEPTEWLAQVPVIENCRMTGGDVAVARPGPRIFFCQRMVNRINSQYPGFGHFAYVHEFGHVAQATSDERQADCWAAQQLANAPDGERFIQAAVRNFMDRAHECRPRYGCMGDRARHVMACARSGGAPGIPDRPLPSRHFQGHGDFPNHGSWGWSAPVDDDPAKGPDEIECPPELVELGGCDDDPEADASFRSLFGAHDED
jgi:hypothetical protein